MKYPAVSLSPLALSSRCMAVFTLLMVFGCSSAPESTPRYDTPLPPGSVALRPVSPGRHPDLQGAWANRDGALVDAINNSLAWYTYPSSSRKFPYRTTIGEITHADAQASLKRFSEILQQSRGAVEFEQAILDEFQVYESVGWDGNGGVLFTGYYAPDFAASLVPTDRFQHPVYARPMDLVTDPEDGFPIGQRLPDGSIGTYPTRREITESNMLAGTEVAWLETALDAYVVHVNGSSRLMLPDGSIKFIGYAGKTDRPYRGLGREVVNEGLVSSNDLSLSAIYDLHGEDPRVVEELINRNENFVFFKDYDGSNWPAGSLGVKVTPKRSLATDKNVYPLGALCLVDTQGVSVSGSQVPFRRFMLDQDTGGAIKAPGRADIYMGEGNDAETLAGGQYSEGRLYYIFLKP